MTHVDIVPAQLWHLQDVARDIRQADRDEIAAMSGRKPFQALEYSLARSDFSRTGMVNGVPVCVFGVGTMSLLGSVGVPWLIGTEGVERNYRVFARRSKVELVGMRDRYAKLINAVDDRNELSKRWLKWLGFTIGEPKVMGVEKRLFRVFEMDGNHV